MTNCSFVERRSQERYLIVCWNSVPFACRMLQRHWRSDACTADDVWLGRSSSSSSPACPPVREQRDHVKKCRLKIHKSNHSISCVSVPSENTDTKWNWFNGARGGERLQLFSIVHQCLCTVHKGADLQFYVMTTEVPPDHIKSFMLGVWG